ncbi:hypothetical protein CK203_032910 [Vitis vinifera]|uniref:Uncharacterized protein n=1 Tax=Vitis vinifera TaxID=29760 RepID=A0A438HKZ0_VITVI|nr:hypothetical protein CK203_032910 [Vitis vinifera]
MRISYPLTHSAEDKGKINEDTTSLERKFVTKVEEPDMAGDSTTGLAAWRDAGRRTLNLKIQFFPAMV